MAEINSGMPFDFFMCGWKFNIFWSRFRGWFGCGQKEMAFFGDGSSGRDSYTCSFRPLKRLKDVIPRWGACMDKDALIVTNTGSLIGFGTGFGTEWRYLDLKRALRLPVGGEAIWAVLPESSCDFYTNFGAISNSP
jgi:hypothetical protein